MNKKILIPIIVTLIIAAGIGAYFIFQKPTPQPQIGKCGDGICDAKEKANPNLCPKDCQLEQLEACGPNNNGYCIDFRETCKANYEGIGPSTCKAEKSAQCCVSVELKTTIGFLGCSITHNAVDGYFEVGGSNFWTIEREEGSYSGGSLDKWYTQLSEGIGSPGKTDYWSIFQNYLNQNPDTKRIWWELCSSAAVADLKYENVLTVLDEIKKRAPDAEIYATPMPLFLDTAQGICVDNNGPQITKDFTDRMVEEGRVKAGHVLSSLRKAQITADGCHANEQGQAIWGRDLMDFFGSL